MAPVPYPARTYSEIHTGILSPVKGLMAYEPEKTPVTLRSLSLLFLSCKFLYQLALGSKDHECHTKYGICTSGEDGESLVCTIYAELHLRTLRSAYPVALCLFDGVCPINSLQTVEQSL